MTPFLEALSALLRTQAARVDSEDQDLASIGLAASLFAAATYLRERYGNAFMDTRSPLVATELQDALELASNVSTTDPVTAYLQVCGALGGLDEHYRADRLTLDKALPSQTDLEVLRDESRPALFGTVHHWIRPQSPWRGARQHREDLLPEVNIYPPTPADRLDVLGMVWDRGEFPSIRPVQLGDLPPRSGSFRIALCPLFCGEHPRFAVTADGGQFTIDRENSYSNQERLQKYLASLAPKLEVADVQLLVLPELAVNEPCRRQLEDILATSRSLVGVVAGSFHIWTDEDQPPYNEAVVYVPRGVAWTHRKLGYFRVTAKQIRGLPTFFRQPVPELQSRVIEGIRRGSELQFWDTRFGRLALLICADAIARESMMPAVERCRPDLLLLPSLSMETQEFERLGESLARRGISVAYLNAGCACVATPDALAAFVSLAMPTPKDAPFPQITWRRGGQPRASGPKQPAADAPPDQVELIGEGEALVFDLIQHLAWRRTPDP